jgi:PAS domain S-box-containing protein
VVSADGRGLGTKDPQTSAWAGPALRGSAGVVSATIHSRRMIVGYAPSRRWGWAVGAQIDQATVIAPVDRLPRGILVLAGLLAVVIAAGAIRLGRLLRLRASVAAAEVHTSEERYRGLVESQHELIVRVDTQGRFTFVNDAYCEKYGLQRDQIVGKTFEPLVQPGDLPPTREAMAALSHPPYRTYAERRTLAVDGERWIGWEDSAIRNAAGDLTGFPASSATSTARPCQPRPVSTSS